ncbi:hypothetical protein TNCT_245891 [Trichonephila clavata]|uniref:Uncharacterized protein n=1 Tax=Trichonephila clavata TaxID=2740835 RepID=A0A8X6H7C2_TRICU|nr:hypothetical protein TNCT_245891 [Trichonephila clavata]
MKTRCLKCGEPQRMPNYRKYRRSSVHSTATSTDISHPIRNSKFPKIKPKSDAIKNQNKSLLAKSSNIIPGLRLAQALKNDFTPPSIPTGENPQQK